jgi:hypothetical protein
MGGNRSKKTYIKTVMGTEKAAYLPIFWSLKKNNQEFAKEETE